MAEVTMVQALNRALRDSLADDDRMLLFGEDIGKLGGVFRVTDGLQDEFGEERVFDSPLAESGIAGVAVGLAIAGWRPVVEMQFDGFSYPALDQIINHVAKYRNRSRGRQPMPMVVRIPVAGGYGGAEHHNDSPETYYAHTAGLKVVIPSTPLDAYSLLRQSIAEPIGRARVVREGGAVTIVTYGAMVAKSLAAAARLAEEDVEAQVLDLRSLVPLDVDAIGSAVRSTGRAVVVHEAPLTVGFGAEIAARIMEEAFDHLEAPVARVAGYDIPYPPATIEEHYVPSADRIARAVRRTLEY
jgi:2-oxoisovalerate dehydrogenase E1 component beta subunit